MLVLYLDHGGSAPVNNSYGKHQNNMKNVVNRSGESHRSRVGLNSPIVKAFFGQDIAGTECERPEGDRAGGTKTSASLGS